MSRSRLGRSLVLGLTLLLVTAQAALADTAAPPAADASNNTILLAVVALGALTAIIVLNRPRRGSGPK